MLPGFLRHKNCWGIPYTILVLAACILLQGCASQRIGGPASAATPGASAIIVPPGTYQRAQEEQRMALANKGIKLAHGSRPEAPKATPMVRPPGSMVWLFASASTQDYLQKTGVDASVNTGVWERFLRKYKIPFTRITNAQSLEQMGSGVLILPSTVVLSDREEMAIAGFRAKGGSILATWLNGVRKDSGEWLGFDFMEKQLGVKVAGNTEADAEDNFMIVHGDNPVAHDLPAGTRIWLDSIKDLLPLRLVAPHYAADIMDWSRTFTPTKVTGLITLDERPEVSGKTSRAVVLGYPEQAWLAADPKALEAIAYNALNWLFRQPQVYIAAWPHPYHAGFVMAVEAAEEVADVDLDFAKKLEDVGGHATYYVMGENIAKSASIVRKLQARGHEIGYYGDKFDEFKGQSAATQGKRLDSMRKTIADAGVKIPERASFAAPMEAYDKLTEQLLQERGFDNYIAFMDVSDGRLPVFAQPGPDMRKATVILPRTQLGPEESMAEGDADEGLQNFLDELDLSLRMGGLAVARIPAQTILTAEQRDKMFAYLQTQRAKTWMVPSNQVAQWWRDRARITARLESSDKGPLLKVSVVGALSPKDSVAIWINLPQAGGRLRLESPQSDNPLPPVAPVDDWRAAVLLQELVPGEYDWYLRFDEPVAANKVP